jgi:serine/threonine-protein kinase
MVLVVIGSTWWVTLGRYTDAPPMVNMTKDQAELYARQHNFELFYGDGAYSETVPKDTVVNQNPAPQERIVKGGTITLTLSLGKERFEVPDLTGLELAAAKTEQAQANLKYKEGAGQYSDTVPEGAVLSTNPAKGTELKRGDTVTVVTSKGRAPISVPDLVGKNVNDARNQLQQLGLTAVERYKDSDQPADTVIAQSPKPGTGAANDAEVTLDVSKGPPLITIQDVNNQQCQQAQAALQQQGLQVQITGFNPQGFVRGMNPPANTQVPPQTQVILQCF